MDVSNNVNGQQSTNLFLELDKLGHAIRQNGLDAPADSNLHLFFVVDCPNGDFFAVGSAFFQKRLTVSAYHERECHGEAINRIPEVMPRESDAESNMESTKRRKMRQRRWEEQRMPKTEDDAR
jgi:hypothetical protein